MAKQSVKQFPPMKKIKRKKWRPRTAEERAWARRIFPLARRIEALHDQGLSWEQADLHARR